MTGSRPPSSDPRGSIPVDGKTDTIGGGGQSRSPESGSSMVVFDRALHAKRRARARNGFREFAFLKARVAEDFVQRLASINRTFSNGLDLGAHDGLIARTLMEAEASADRVEAFTCGDLAGDAYGVGCIDEEALAFESATFDLIVSGLSLHWVNDLPGTLIQIQRTLKPDGLFVGALFGGRTLMELRQSLMEAEAEIRGGVGPRVSPFMDVFDGANLLQRAGFAMPVSDKDTVTVRYDNLFKLLADLRGMGETACFADRSGPGLTRGILLRAAEIYARDYSDADGRVRATFEIVTLSGWAPGANQPIPKRPGSATTRLSDALGVQEYSLSSLIDDSAKPDDPG